MKVTALGPQHLGDPWDSFQWSRKGNAKRVHLRTVEPFSPPLCGVNLDPQVDVCVNEGDTITLCPKCAKLARTHHTPGDSVKSEPVRSSDHPAAIYLHPDELTPWSQNPRVNEHAVQDVANSITRFGFASPIVARSEDRRVIAGHTRLLAAKHLGLTSVPVRLIDVTDSEADALALADNKLGEIADWDESALSEIIQSLTEQGTDLTGLGWEEQELDDLVQSLDDLGDTEPEPEDEPPEVMDEIPDEVEPVCQTGDVHSVDRHTVHIGDCLHVLRSLPPNSVDALVTDPPYGLSAPPDVSVVLTQWMKGERYEHGTPGFMGRDWDSFVPGPEVWREVFRVMKPGAYGVVFAGTRTVDLMGMALRIAGFEIRDNIAWIYGSGFPKSTSAPIALDKNAGVMDHRGVRVSVAGNRNMGGEDIPNASHVPTHEPITPLAQKFRGYGSALKPAHEPAVLIRKPLDGTMVENIHKWGTGAVNVDGTRIRTSEQFGGGPKGSSGFASGYQDQGWVPGSDLGRWPPNVVLGHLDGCDPDTEDPGCEPGCPVRTLDEQSGDTGTPSRFFYCPKASRSERELGLDDLPTVTGAQAVNRKEGSAGLKNPRAGAGRTATEVRNIHPTVKPHKLMKWCATLVTPPPGQDGSEPVVLDPFCGSGTTLLACESIGVTGVGIELEPRHGDIILARLRHLCGDTDEG